MHYSKVTKYIGWLVVLFVLSFPVGAQTTRVACVGNSVTYGYKLANRERDNYPHQLQLLLGPRYDVRNFGHSGATLLSKGHNPYIKTSEYQEALAFQPDIVVIHLGLNDTDPRDWPNYRDDFISNYQDLIHSFKTRSGRPSKVYICLMTPIFSRHPRFKSGTRDWFWQVQQCIKKVASNCHVSLIDLHSPLYDRPDLFADALHPNAEGALIMAHTVYSALNGNFGGFQLAPVFGEHMVFQQKKPIVLFGKANCHDVIKAEFHNNFQKVSVGTEGKWKIALPEVPVGGPYSLKIWVNDTLKVHWTDILVGEVWLISGQSNMQFMLRQSKQGGAAVLHAKNSKLRLFNYKGFLKTRNVQFDSISLQKIDQLKFFNGHWQLSTPESASVFSAIGYYFGKELENKLHVPVGVIQVTVGGAPIESFIDRKTLEFSPVLVDVLNLNTWKNNDMIMKWVRQRAEKNISLSNNSLQRHPYQPAYIYEAGISHVIGFPVRGVLWYQGESNARNCWYYPTAFRAMVASWRNGWNDQRLPFVFAQLSSLNRPDWPAFRNMQRELADSMANVHMVVTMDVGDSTNVHYIRKQPVANRFYLQALHHVYGRRISSDGPVPFRHRFYQNKLILTLKHCNDLMTSDGKDLRGLEVAGVDSIYHPMHAVLRHRQIIITDTLNNLVGVRYGWNPFSHGNLVNEGRLPAPTFQINIKK